MAAVITQSDLLDALTAANAAPAEARTVAEIVNVTGWHPRRVREAIGRLAMQNRIEAYRVTRPSIDGRNMSSPAYVVLPAKPKRSK